MVRYVVKKMAAARAAKDMLLSKKEGDRQTACSSTIYPESGKT